jgi:hypothetical protein
MVDSLSVLGRVMDFQSAMETFAEAWVAANVTQVSSSISLFVNCLRLSNSSRTQNITKKKVDKREMQKGSFPGSEENIIFFTYLKCSLFTPEDDSDN